METIRYEDVMRALIGYVGGVEKLISMKEVVSKLFDQILCTATVVSEEGDDTDGK